MERFVCIHGHFSQPPRENPWLESVDLDDSAYPYHDWNERITAECYAPNTVARILDERGLIASIVNNYSRLSFDFSPKLLAWLAERAPETYQAILEADRQSCSRFGRHGTAIAAPYGDPILPLLDDRDRRTLVLWGVRDFQERFRRTPEGMWLPEMAVDLPTLETVAAQGITFVFLAPAQAARVRHHDSHSWEDASGGRIDCSRAYQLRLPSGRSLAVLFQEPGVSDAVAFRGLLGDGERFASTLTGALPERDGPVLVAAVTDGESYGHYHPHGDMALAVALEILDAGQAAKLTVPAAFIEQHPPTHELEIVPGSSATCPHGLSRWQQDCGCGIDARAGQTRLWCASLRRTLLELHRSLASLYEERSAALFVEPWAARDAYIQVMMDRSPATVARFLERHVGRRLSTEEEVCALQLLEMQRQSLQMMASRQGWAAVDVSDPEAVQLIRYAARALQLARDATTVDLEPALLQGLASVPSRQLDLQNAVQLYERSVVPGTVDLGQVCAHYAITSLIERHPEHARVFNYLVDRGEEQRLEVGAAKVVLGRMTVTSSVTREAEEFAFGMLHLGGHDVSAGVRRFRSAASLDQAALEAGKQEEEHALADLYAVVAQAVEAGGIAEVVRVLDLHFGGLRYSAQSLFSDARRAFMNATLESTLAEDAAIFRQLYNRRVPIMRLLTTLGEPLPKALLATAEFVINQELRQAFADPDLSREAVQNLLDNGRTWMVALDTVGLGFVLAGTIERAVARVRDLPGDMARLETLEKLVDVAREMPFSVNFWAAQNLFVTTMQRTLWEMLERADEGDAVVRRWVDAMQRIGVKLGVSVTDPRQQRPLTTMASALRDTLVPARIPRATYRLQFCQHFTFDQARELVPYLQRLGISDLYLSPVLQARRGSSHGYDLCDHSKLNQSLGGEAGFGALMATVREHEMGILLDTVPNHMGIGGECNHWWMDVLENGPSSAFASYFDIEWSPVKPELANKVLLPILEDQYGRVLERCKLRLVFEEGSFFLYYYDHKLPLAPRTYKSILELRLPSLVETLGEDNEHVQEYRSILTAIGYLPSRTERDPTRIAERNREKEVIKRRILALYQSVPEVAACIDTAITAINGREGDASSFDLLDELIAAQAFRPAYWRVAGEEINYRRFFDINELAAVCTEDEQVFHATHELTFGLLAGGAVTGLRIDHIDGLYDPEGYLRQLQETYLSQCVARRLAESGGEVVDKKRLAARVAHAFSGNRVAGEPRASPLPLFVVAEKVLGEDEQLPESWAVYGTTGYDFLAKTNALFVDQQQASELDQICRWFVGPNAIAIGGYQEEVSTSKKMTMLVSMASEVQELAHRLERLAERNRRYRDFTLGMLTFALREVIAALPVYRTYIFEAERVSERDRRYIEAAVAEASRRNPRTARAIFEFIREILLLRCLADFPQQDRPLLVEWVRKFQQVTGPVMAKGVEDTAFYRYNRLVSLNEVGGDPDEFGLDVAAYHQCQQRRLLWPHSLLASSTHDSKRGEDTRARINVLSENPAQLRVALQRWRAMNSAKKPGDHENIPDANDEYMLYQNLIGAWPFELLNGSNGEPVDAWQSFRERLVAYMRKATKEAKVHTSWVNPNQAYDEGVATFVERVLSGVSGDPFIADMRQFLPPIVTCGVYNSLSQTLLKLTVPGIPDFYQGAELWNLSLVDPDNRRHVDYDARRLALEMLRGRVMEAEVSGQLGSLLDELLRAPADGMVKLYLIWRLLELRRVRPALFADSDYQPLAVEGTRANHLCAFARSLQGETLLVLAPRLFFALSAGGTRLPVGEAVWEDTCVVLAGESPDSTCREILTGQVVPIEGPRGRASVLVGRVLRSFPVAVLYSDKRCDIPAGSTSRERSG